MNTEEYARMFAAEDGHWWYRALHAHVSAACCRYVREGGHIVDVGCGTGAVAAQLAGSAAVTGIDFSPDGLACCRERRLHRLARGDAMHLPLAPGCADGVLLLDVLYHKNVADPAQVLADTARVLAPGGVVIINVPAYQWLYSSHDVAVHTGRRFTRPQVVGMLREEGFEVLRASYWNTVLFPAIAAVRVVRRWLPPSGSDVSEDTPPVINGLLGMVMAFERSYMRVFPLPFGVSIFVVARRAADGA